MIRSISTLVAAPPPAAPLCTYSRRAAEKGVCGMPVPTTSRLRRTLRAVETPERRTKARFADCAVALRARASPLPCDQRCDQALSEPLAPSLGVVGAEPEGEGEAAVAAPPPPAAPVAEAALRAWRQMRHLAAATEFSKVHAGQAQTLRRLRRKSSSSAMVTTRPPTEATAGAASTGAESLASLFMCSGCAPAASAARSASPYLGSSLLNRRCTASL